MRRLFRFRSPPRATHARGPRLPVRHEVSAGGVVVRRRRGRWQVALLKTRHARGEVWVLPKGHLEHERRETRERAAVREVREELGIPAVRVLRELGTTRWQFVGSLDRRRGSVPRRRASPCGRGRPSEDRPVRILKTAHYYLMEGLSDVLRPQREEGFLEARWVTLAEALRLLAYPTDRSLIARAIQWSRRRP